MYEAVTPKLAEVGTRRVAAIRGTQVRLHVVPILDAAYRVRERPPAVGEAELQSGELRMTTAIRSLLKNSVLDQTNPLILVSGTKTTRNTKKKLPEGSK